MKTLRIGIMSQDKVRARVKAIAAGQYKPKKGEPKIWFTSMRSLAEVLSDKNRALLHAIVENKPESLSALARCTGRKQSNLSRTLKTLSGYGFVELKECNKLVVPIVKATEFEILAA